MKIIGKTNANQSENNEYPIGHIFELYDIKLIVKEDELCDSCFFRLDIMRCAKQKCSSFDRIDKKSVSFHIFKDYENNKKNKFKKWLCHLFSRR